MNNYQKSINKWEDIKNDIKNDKLDTSTAGYLTTIVYTVEGFCHEFMVNSSCKHCPLSQKHCNTDGTFCRMKNNTVAKIEHALAYKQNNEAIKLIEYFIRCMNHHKSKFK